MTSRSSSAVIALFLGNLEMGGGERVLLTLGRRFARRGYRVRLILAHKIGPLLGELDPAIEVIDLNAARANQAIWLFGLRTLLKLAYHLRLQPPDVLLSTLTGANLVAILARYLSRNSFRLIIREAVTLSNVRGGRRLTAMRILYPFADQIIALTEPIKTQLIERLALNADKITVVGNPLDIERINQLLRDDEEQRRSQQYRPYWLCIGRLVEQKGFSTLIQAASHLKGHQTIRFVILGDGPLRGELEGQIRHYGLEDRVTLIGFTANPYPWLENASGFVLPSRWEGYPNVLLEAMHFNLPVVATHYDDSVKELLDFSPGAPHRLVPVGDSYATALAIEELVDGEHVFREEAGKRTKTTPRVPSSIQDVVDNYLAVLLPNEAGGRP